MSYLVTGASGFLGRRVMAELRDQAETIRLIVRPASVPGAQRLYGDWPNVRILPGDLRDFDAGLESETLDEISRQVKTILHMAASYDLGAGAPQNYIHNIVGTQNLLGLCDRLGALQDFVTTSTIAVAGEFSGIFHENMFNVGQSFPNPYAETKFRVEGLVGAWRTRVRKHIIRLGILVGDSRTGVTEKIDGPYYLFRSLRRQRALWRPLSIFGRTPLPFATTAKIHLVPVDAAARAVAYITHSPRPFTAPWRTYHVTGEALPLPDFLERSFRELGYRTKLIPLGREWVPASLYPQLGMPPSLQHYMFSEAEFANTTLREDYPEAQLPAFADYADALYAFVRGEGFDRLDAGE